MVYTALALAHEPIQGSTPLLPKGKAEKWVAVLETLATITAVVLGILVVLKILPLIALIGCGIGVVVVADLLIGSIIKCVKAHQAAKAATVAPPFLQSPAVTTQPPMHTQQTFTQPERIEELAQTEVIEPSKSLTQEESFTKLQAKLKGEREELESQRAALDQHRQTIAKDIRINARSQSEEAEMVNECDTHSTDLSFDIGKETDAERRAQLRAKKANTKKAQQNYESQVDAVKKERVELEQKDLRAGQELENINRQLKDVKEQLKGVLEQTRYYYFDCQNKIIAKKKQLEESSQKQTFNENTFEQLNLKFEQNNEIAKLEREETTINSKLTSLNLEISLL